MKTKNNMNMVVSVIICLAVVGILIFISVNKKSEENNMINSNTNPNGDVVGESNVAKTGDTVSMNYTGRLENGTVFDSNVDPQFRHVEPFVFILGAGQVISGWDKGIVGMKVGEKKTLTIPPEEAYGQSGQGPIPPNATLIFDVELVAIIK